MKHACAIARSAEAKALIKPEAVKFRSTGVPSGCKVLKAASKKNERNVFSMGIKLLLPARQKSHGRLLLHIA